MLDWLKCKKREEQEHMEIHVDGKRNVEGAGDFICTVDKNLYVLALDPTEKYPYLLLSIQSFQIVQNYDEIPSREELEEDIGEEIKEIYSQEYASISLS